MTGEALVLISPLIVVELILKIICIRDWLHREQFNGIGRIPWLLIVLFVNLFGPLAYLLYGRKTYGNH
jgi:hypothetical protein